MLAIESRGGKTGWTQRVNPPNPPKWRDRSGNSTHQPNMSLVSGSVRFVRPSWTGVVRVGRVKDYHVVSSNLFSLYQCSNHTKLNGGEGGILKFIQYFFNIFMTLFNVSQTDLILVKKINWFGWFLLILKCNREFSYNIFFI